MEFESIVPKYTSFLKDESRATGISDSIFFPKTKEEAISAVTECKEKHLPLTFQGNRTGFLGGALPNAGRIVNFSKMTKCGEIQAEKDAFFIVAQSGVSLAELENKAREKGLFFPVEPTEDTASLGGMFSTNASGPNAFYYGSFSQYVSSMDFVTPNGETFFVERGKYLLENGKYTFENNETLDLSTWDIPTKPLKDGMDFIDFLSGTEGYFGAPLSFQLKLLPLLKEHWGIVFFFETEKACASFADSVKSLVQQNTPAHIVSAEFYNQKALNIFKNHLEHPLLKKLPSFPSDVTSALYLELEGESEDEVSEILMQLLEEFENVGGKEEHTWAESGEDAIAPLKAMRHALVSILNETETLYDSNGFRLESDCAFLEKSPKEILEFYHAFCKKHVISPILYGSLLLGELHIALEPTEESQKAFHEFYTGAYQNNGLLFSKYGISKKNISIWKELLSSSQVETLEKVRKFFDSELLMNP